MLLFHTTEQQRADAIERKGFRGGAGSYGTATSLSGVWLADRVVDVNEGAAGDAVLVLDIPEQVVAGYELQEDAKPYREFIVPAEVVNGYPLAARRSLGDFPPLLQLDPEELDRAAAEEDDAEKAEKFRALAREKRAVNEELRARARQAASSAP